MKGAFARRHPAVNVLFFVLAALPSALNSHPLILLVSAFAAFAYSLRLRGSGALGKSLLLLILPVVLTSLVNGAFNHYGITTLYTLPSGNRITLEAFTYGAAAGTAIAAMLLWFVCWNEVVTEDKFMCLFGRVAPHTALLVLMILMCVFKKVKSLQYVIAAFVLSIFVMLYFLIPNYKPWQLFIIAAPAVAIVFLACNIQKKPEKRKKSKQ